MLRSALAELPDLVPSRRLQLLPPVEEKRAADAGGWLRRLSAPIMAAGLGLVLVGAVGTSGMLDFAASGGAPVFAPAQPSVQDISEGAGGAAASSPGERLNLGSPAPRPQGAQPTAATQDSGASGAESSPTARERASEAPAASGGDLESSGAPQPTAPWLALLLAGLAFVVTGGVLRVFVPRS
jgi:uncharacterized membrane protein YedE/YeeE